MSKKWKWLGVDAITNEVAIKKIKHTQENGVSQNFQRKDNAQCNVSGSKKRNKVTYRCSLKPSRGRNYRKSNVYYERFRYAPSARGIKFYGTKP